MATIREVLTHQRNRLMTENLKDFEQFLTEIFYRLDQSNDETSTLAKVSIIRQYLATLISSSLLHIVDGPDNKDEHL